MVIKMTTKQYQLMSNKNILGEYCSPLICYLFSSNKYIESESQAFYYPINCQIFPRTDLRNETESSLFG